MKSIGTPADRQDGRLKVTGGAKYSAEFDLPNMAYAALVLSPVARGRVKGFDLRNARTLPGVLEILTHENMPKLARLGAEAPSDVSRSAGESRLPLQDAEIGYSGQIIACVIADTYERARDAAARVVADIEEAKPFLGMRPAPKDQTVRPDQGAPPPVVGETIKPEKYGGKGMVQVQHNEPEKAFKASAQKVEAEYKTPYEHHTPLEPHAIIAAWDAEGSLTAYLSSQSTNSPQGLLAYVFGLPKEKVRTVAHFVGGAFGSKGSMWTHDILCAVAAQRVKRPVKLALRRQDTFSLVGHRPETRQTVRIGADNAGQITAITHDTLTEGNPNNKFFEPCGRASEILYAMPAFGMTHEVTQVNVAPPTYMRAPGESPGMWAMEAAIDEMAHAAQMDPVAFRLLNHADAHPIDKKPWSSKLLKECYAKGQELIGWQNRKVAPRAVREGRYLIGYGMATATYPANRTAAAAKVRLFADGRAIASSSGTDLGTGAYTIFRQVAADSLTLPLDRVVFEMGDSTLPFAPVAGGSQLTASVAPAVQEACERALQDIALMAVKDAKSPLFNRDPASVTFTDGRAHIKDDASKGETISEIVTRSGKPFVEHCVRAETMLTAKNNQGLKQSQGAPCTPVMPQSEMDADQDKYAFHSFGAHFCRVRVDEELGVARVMDWAAVMDVGRILNPKTSRSQILGGIVMGIGMALMEETFYHPQNGKVGKPGRPVTRNVADYHVASHADVPPIQVAFIDEPDPHINSLGARGVGEIGITGVPAAIGNAIFNATGRRIRDLPITPEKLMAD